MGPKIGFQSPANFMNHDINISTEQIHQLLANTFAKYDDTGENQNDDSAGNGTMDGHSVSKEMKDATTTKGPNKNSGSSSSSSRKKQERIITSASGTANKDDKSATPKKSSPSDLPAKKTTKDPSTRSNEKERLDNKSAMDDDEDDVDYDKDDGEDTDVILPPGALSIFDSTSEYIITGHELSDKTISLSTHGMHIVTRPTVIHDNRYERNALLFSVGFVIRRAVDPSPFRPLLSQWALTLRGMEIESQVLSKPQQLRYSESQSKAAATTTTTTSRQLLRPRKQRRPRYYLQTVLERILISLNSSNGECNLVLNRSNGLNLKLYHPPRPVASPVHDHEVPILLRRDIQLQMVRKRGRRYTALNTP